MRYEIRHQKNSRLGIRSAMRRTPRRYCTDRTYHSAERQMRHFHNVAYADGRTTSSCVLYMVWYVSCDRQRQQGTEKRAYLRERRGLVSPQLQSLLGHLSLRPGHARGERTGGGKVMGQTAGDDRHGVRSEAWLPLKRQDSNEKNDCLLSSNKQPSLRSWEAAEHLRYTFEDLL